VELRGGEEWSAGNFLHNACGVFAQLGLQGRALRKLVFRVLEVGLMAVSVFCTQIHRPHLKAIEYNLKMANSEREGCFRFRVRIIFASVSSKMRTHRLHGEG
jgi:hypothetical protein